MSLLQFILFIFGFALIIIVFDAYVRRKLNGLNFVIILGGSLLIGFFLLFPHLLDQIGSVFGATRGTDLIVYFSILTLAYFYISVLGELYKVNRDRTELARYIAISSRKGELINPKIVAIVPCYNESSVCIEVTKNLIVQGTKVVVVDDGKNHVDFHKQLAREIENHDVCVITHPMNMGKGAAQQTATDYLLKNFSDIEYVVHIDSDGQHLPEELHLFLQEMEKDPGLDVVFGSRVLGKAINIPRLRKFHKWLQVLFMKMVVGIQLTDTNNGYRVFRYRVIPNLRITLNRYSSDSELEAMIHRQKMKYKEVPITVLYTDYSLAKGQKLSNAFVILKDLFYKWMIEK